MTLRYTFPVGCCDAHEAQSQEALAIAEIEIGLAAVVEDVGLAVLEGAHGPGVDVQVRIDLYGGDAEPAALVQWRAPCRGTFLNPLARTMCYNVVLCTLDYLI